jgi:hypothetical protein
VRNPAVVTTGNWLTTKYAKARKTTKSTKTTGAIETLIRLHLEHVAAGIPPDVEAAWLHHRFVQIHPFQDGNGRVARSLATMVMIRAGLFPLVVTTDDYPNYMDALESADDGDLRPLVQAFAATEQARFDAALDLADEPGRTRLTADRAIAALKSKIQQADEIAPADFQKVFDLSADLEALAAERLEEYRDKLRPIETSVSRLRGDANLEYATRTATAAMAMGYVANFSYRAWVLLVISREPEGRLILSFLARGSEFQGILACLPALDVAATPTQLASGGQVRRIPVPIDDRPFEFYYTEELEEVRSRFIQWLDEVVALAISQYQRML